MSHDLKIWIRSEILLILSMYQIRGLLHDLLWQILIKISKVGEVFSVAGSMALGTAIDLEETSNFHFQKFLKMI